MKENKRFENRLNKDHIKFNTLNPVWDNEKETALNVFEMIDLMNELHDENEELDTRINNLEENLQYYKSKCASLEIGLFQADRKQSKLQQKNKKLTNIIECIEKGSCRSIDSFLDDYCSDELLKEYDLL